MCGINGFNFNSKKIIREMNKAIKHRGPDDEGIFTDKSVSLGNVRLSIIDLSKKGKQPMRYYHKGKEIIIVFNGEIYNFLELKKYLEEKGYSFKSKADTEVILASYMEWGTDCVKRFNGMWAFCIYDKNKNIFFCSRDRLGVKPLYYFFDGIHFIFSSEIKGLLTHEKLKINLEKNLDKKGIDFFFATGYIPSPYTIYKKVIKLPSATNMIFDLKRRKIKKWKYWEIPKFNPENNKEEIKKEVYCLIEDAIKKRLVSDVEIGVFLSGGLDSSTVVAIMSKFVNLEKLHTFSIGFKGDLDETLYIKEVVNFLKTKHHHIYFDEKEFNELINFFVFAYDEPFADYSGFPTYKISKIASKYLKVVLGGDGGDEIFGGYEHYWQVRNLILLTKLPRFFRRLILPIIPQKKELIKIRKAIKISLQIERDFSLFYGDDEEKYLPDIYRNWIRKKLQYCLKKTGGNAIEAIRLLNLLYTTLSDNFLTKVDRASMVNGLEVRSPFLDYRFAELSQKIPTNLKVGINKGKLLMREIIKGFLPSKIVKRRKQGFIPPIDSLVQHKDEAKNWIETLYRKKIINRDIYNFYQQNVFTKKSRSWPIYIVRLLIFYKWYLKWVIYNENCLCVS